MPLTKNRDINYLSKDFNSIKADLMDYVRRHFPNDWRDFNEASGGMALLELMAYVGDILNFYVDKQYKEMMLPLAEERKNVVNIAKMLGYKVKPSSTTRF